MTREEKVQLVDGLIEKLDSIDYFYVTDASGMSVAEINQFRNMCFDAGLEYMVIKNTLIAKALERLNADYSEFSEKVLKGFSGVIFSPEAGNRPAKVLKEFRKKTGKKRPVLKGASVDASFFFGDEQLDQLAELKSREELIGEIIGLLQSPAKNVISALKSPAAKLAGILQTLEERESE